MCGKLLIGTMANNEDLYEIPNVRCGTSLGFLLFAMTKLIFNERKTIYFGNNNVWFLNIYNGPSLLNFVENSV